PCVNGYCDEISGGCTCSSVNWAGELCSECNRTFYGPYCLPIPTVLLVAPSTGPDIGGTVVNVIGHNFENSSDGLYRCRFGDIDGIGQWLSREKVRCISPKQVGEVPVNVGKPGGEFTNQRVKFKYHPTCPSSACGRNETPPHGICLFGQCSCILPWEGESCQDIVIAPLFKDVNLTSAKEGKRYEAQMDIKQGTRPVTWQLLNGPSGMSLDPRSGLLVWPRTLAQKEPYDVRMRVENVIGSDIFTFKLSVPFSYNATVTSLSVSGILS
ncbi:unnamed protein product, partial [Owenia fusiformis]